MCFGMAERTGGRSDPEDFGCFKIEIGAVVPDGRLDGVEALDVEPDADEGAGPESVRGCVDDLVGTW